MNYLVSEHPNLVRYLTEGGAPTIQRGEAEAILPCIVQGINEYVWLQYIGLK